MGKNTIWQRLAVVASVLGLLVACGNAPTTGSASESATAMPGMAGAAELEGTQWQLMSYGPADSPVTVLAGSQVTARFEAGGKLNGSAGCNSYSTTFTLDGMSFSTGEIASTLMACADNNVTQQETTYLTALRSATALHQSGDDLTIDYADGTLRFTKMTSAGATP